jgi:hypothetical protein
MILAKVLTCILRHAQIHSKRVEPENVILLSILHKTVTSGAVPLPLITVRLTKSRKREGATTWQRCTKPLSPFRQVRYSK